MKIVKSILVSILSILLVLDLILLGVAFNLKSTIKETVSTVLKQSVSNEIMKTVEDNLEVENIDKDKVSKEIQSIIKDNKNISNMMDNCFDIVLDALSGKDGKIELNLEEDIDSLLEDSEKILKEYNIELDEKSKQEIKEFATNPEVTDTLNEGLNSLKSEMPSELQMILDITNFVTGSTFKIILISALVVILVLIALLKKSYYQWLSYLGTASIISGIPLVMMPYVVNVVAEKLDNSISISLSSASGYGYVSIALGIIEIIIQIVIHKMRKKKEVIKF